MSKTANSSWETTGKPIVVLTVISLIVSLLLALVNGMTAPVIKENTRRTTLAAIRKDEADLVVGTHAILSEGVDFARLGLAVVDEQHRFGVRQRTALAEKGEPPNVLVMSATPIPRTLALILYGDMDLSVIDERPANRLPIKNCAVNTDYRPNAYRFMLKQIEEGRQVYICLLYTSPSPRD